MLTAHPCITVQQGMLLVHCRLEHDRLECDTVRDRDRFDGALRAERDRPRPSLLRACRLTFGREFLGLGWLKAANAALGFCGPLLLKVVVDAVQDVAQGEEEGPT